MPITVAAPARLGLIGGECTGKSTLAIALAAALPACVVDEVLRTETIAAGRPPRRDEQAALMRRQAEHEDDRARSCALPAMVADPAPLMTAVYSRLYFDDDSLTDVAIAHAAGYRLLVWCAPDLPWIPEPGVRDGAEYRERADAQIADIVVTRLQPLGVPVLRVTGILEQRVASVLQAWQQPALNRPT
jgi:nicotinamide riboside kinase